MAGTFSNILIHVVFSTKNREHLIDKTFEGELYSYIGGIVKNERGTLLSAGGVSDHVHLLLRVSPAISISEMLKKIKGNSSIWINKEKKTHCHFSWQQGYAAFAVSESNKDSVIAYIKRQKEHHRVTSFKEELLRFLKRHNVEYDERYIWT